MRTSTPLSILGLALIPVVLTNCSDAESHETAAMEDGGGDYATAEANENMAPASEENGEYNFTTELRADFHAPEGMVNTALHGQVEVLQPEPEMEGNPAPHLKVELSGLEPGEHAWHIHDGPCGEPASVLIPLTSTADMEGVGEPLVADESGHAIADLPVPPLSDLALGEGKYSLHVHESGGVDHGATVACATL